MGQKYFCFFSFAKKNSLFLVISHFQLISTEAPCFVHLWAQGKKIDSEKKNIFRDASLQKKDIK